MFLRTIVYIGDDGYLIDVRGKRAPYTVRVNTLKERLHNTALEEAVSDQVSELERSLKQVLTHHLRYHHEQEGE